MTELETIGDLSGKVMIDRAARAIILAVDGLNPIKFPIDHPLIQGTKLERAASTALASVNRSGADK